VKLSDLPQCLETAPQSLPDADVTGIRNDTRKISPGDIFVAISGAAEDGHGYAQEAISKGASLVVTEQPMPPHIPHILVPDSRVALARLSARFYGNPSERLYMIGVTGTNGKTTVTHLVHQILESAGHRAGLIGTNHVLIGEQNLPAERTTPDAAALHQTLGEMTAAGCTHCVMEVSSHALVQQRVYGVRYGTAVFTGLRHEHLDYHRDMEDYFAAKRRLFDICDHAVVNIDDEWGRRLARMTEVPTLPYSAEGRQGGVWAENIQFRADGVRFDAVTPEGTAPAFWGTPGLFSVQNALAAIACGILRAIPLPQITAALAACRPVKGRMEIVPSDGGFTILIDYAHTPDALENALSALRPHCQGRLIALFGCGGDRDRAKRPLMGEAVSRLSDVAVLTSDNPRTEDPEQIIGDALRGMSGEPITAVNRREAIFKALSLARPGDTVVLCGKGHEDYQEINGVKHHFDEREVVAEYYSGTQI